MSNHNIDFWETIADEEFEKYPLYSSGEERLELAQCYAEMFGYELEVMEEE